MSRPEEMLPTPEPYRPFRPIPNPDNPVLVTEAEIRAQLPLLAKQLAPLIRAKNYPILMKIANGGLMFGDDLAVELRKVDPELEFEEATIRYRSRRGVGDESDQRPILDETDCVYPDVDGRNVMFIDDVLDSQYTLVVAEEEARARGGKVTDVIVAVEKESPDEFKGHIRKHYLPEGVRTHALVRTMALWLYKYGMDNGNDKTEAEDRAGREIRVNWDFENEDHPGMVVELRRRFQQKLSRVNQPQA
ncbi:MAG: phosphoribosyltransferase family protein [Microgenomates group bacterium]